MNFVKVTNKQGEVIYVNLDTVRDIRLNMGSSLTLMNFTTSISVHYEGEISHIYVKEPPGDIIAKALLRDQG